MPTIKAAEVAVGGNRADHWLLVYYVVNDKQPTVLDAYMLHNKKRRPIKISDRIYQYVLDGLYGYIAC
jgi:hypothetical protein